MKSKNLFLIAGILFLMGAVNARAAWPTTRIFSPYVDVTLSDNLQPAKVKGATGQKYYTLAFVVADGTGNPAWGGVLPVSGGYYSSQINSLRSAGGDAIFSFGGENGTELALLPISASTLQSKYQAVINKYKATWLDFDIEGGALYNTTANQKRNSALKGLQSANSGLVITYTLPADPDGISSYAVSLLQDAKAKGVRVKAVNVMAMDFGSYYSSGKKLSAVAIATAQKVHSQCQSINSSLKIGVTVMIGQNDIQSEVFYTTDASTLVNWAKGQSWVYSLGFWSADRDNGSCGRRTTASATCSGIVQSTWAFMNIFKGFSSPPW